MKGPRMATSGDPGRRQRRSPATQNSAGQRQQRFAGAIRRDHFANSDLQTRSNSFVVRSCCDSVRVQRHGWSTDCKELTRAAFFVAQLSISRPQYSGVSGRTHLRRTSDQFVVVS